MRSLLRRLSLTFFIVLAACSYLLAQQSVTTPVDTFITAEKLRSIVQVLASDSLKGRLTGSDGAVAAAAFIEQYFRESEIDYLEDFKGYYHRYSLEMFGDTVKTFNVVGFVEGATHADTVVIFSAHYDHIGRLDKHSDKTAITQGSRHSGADEIFNGANDNASGVSAMLTLAAYFKKHIKPYYSLLFIGFSGEEEGLYGSTALAAAMPTAQIKYQINLEMLGRPVKKSPFITYKKGTTELMEVLNKNLLNSEKGYGKKYFYKDPFGAESLFSRSDNFPFAQKGVQANTIMASSPFDKYYHHVDDEWETLDYEAMAKIVQAVAIACTPIILGQ